MGTLSTDTLRAKSAESRKQLQAASIKIMMKEVSMALGLREGGGGMRRSANSLL